MKNKICACILAALCLIMAGCGETASTSSENNTSQIKENIYTYETAKKHVSLACSITDSFCPYTAKTLMNRNLSPLLYDSLVVLDNSFTPKKVLAEKISTSGKTVTVTLKDVNFSDGTRLTSEDVVYCYKKAKKSSTKYDYQLGDVESIAQASASVVVFTLKKEDPYFENQLDFPIYKANSENKTSEDNIEIPPIGSGRYVINDKKTELTINKKYSFKKPSVKKIELVNTPDNDALLHNLEIGNVSYYYSDLSDGTLSQVRGNYKKVNTTNIVYLGTNMRSGPMSDGEMRQAISGLIDRTDVVNKAFYQNGVPTKNIFNPEWEGSDAINAVSDATANKNVYLAQLEKIGYNKKDKSGYFVNSNGERLTLKLVSYKGNKWRHEAAKLIASKLKGEGIKVQIDALDWAGYTSALKNGYFDMYIGEVKLGNNMDITSLVTKKGSAAWGVYYKKTEVKKSSSKKDGETSSNNTSSVSASESSNTEESDKPVENIEKVLTEFYKGKKDLNEVSVAFMNDMPIIPILYRTGIVSYSCNVTGITPSSSDIYMNF